jgi:PTS system nitrogen regulatory IIA component
MDISDLIARNQVVAGLRIADKSQLLGEVARRAAAILGMDVITIHDPLLAREKLGSTGIGQGVALPHARIKGLKNVFGLFVRLERPIDFAAIDAQPVDTVFLLLTPDNATNEHLAALACVSRRLRTRDVVVDLRAAADASALYGILTSVSIGRTT